MIDTNVKGLLYVTRVIAPKMVAAGRGHIFNIGSIAGTEAYENGAVYCASKHAVHAISQSMRADLLSAGIKVTEIRREWSRPNFPKCVSTATRSAPTRFTTASNRSPAPTLRKQSHGRHNYRPYKR